MNFDDALHVICPTCDRGAGWHRMTKSGKLYCLLLNKAGVKRRNSIISSGETYDEAAVYQTDIKYLQDSPLDQSISNSILHGLNTYTVEP